MTNTNGFVNVNNNFDYEGFFASAPEYNNSSKRPHTDRQVKYYNDLCRQKGVAPIDLTNKNYDEVSSLIGELKGMKGLDLITPKQKETIEAILERTPSIDINIYMPNYASASKEEASTLIGTLFDLERQHRHLKPASEAQVAKIVRMYLCPDVIFTDIGWEETYQTIGGKRMLLLPNSRDLASWVATNVNQQKASEFITKYNPNYIEWSKTRLSKEQKSHIRTLEARLANLYTAGASHEQATDADGNVIVNDSASRKEWAPKGYEELSEIDLYIMSRDAASKYIEIMSAELSRKDLYKFSQEPMVGDYLEAQRVSSGDESINQDAKHMADFIYGLYAQLGEDLDEVARQHAETPTKRIGYDTIEFVRELIGRSITKGISMSLITDMLDDVPEVKAEVMA